MTSASAKSPVPQQSTQAKKPDAKDPKKGESKMGALRGMSFEDQLAALTPSGGEPLPNDVRIQMERSLGASFTDVRIHQGSHAGSLGARAYTQGTDIFFAPGEYQPKSASGMALLGHELAHVVQQAEGRVAPGKNDDAGLEKSADALGDKAAKGEGTSSGKTVKPSAGKGASIQCKGKATPGSDVRTAARDILRAQAGPGNDIVHTDVPIVTELLGTHTATDITNAINALGLVSLRLGAARFTHMIVANVAGLAVNEILGDEVGTATGSLAATYTLSLALQVAGLTGAVALGVRQALVGVRGDPAIVAAAGVVANLMTTRDRAVAVIDHVSAGGSANDATRADGYAPNDATVFTAALTTLRGLVGIASADQLAGPSLTAVLDERAHLANKNVKTNAVALANGSQTPATDLADTRAFGYSRAFKERAESKGDTAKDELVAKREKTINKDAESKKAKVKEGKSSEAFDKLTRNQRKAFDGDHTKVLTKPIYESNTHAVEGKKSYKTKIEELSKDDVQVIEDKRVSDVDHVKTVEGPEKKSEVVEEHRAFFEKVNHHPDALRALDLSDDDMTLAESIIDAIVAAPGIRDLFTSVTLSATELERALGLAPALLAGALGNGVTAANVKCFMQGDNRATFLSELCTAGVSGARINDCVAQHTQLAGHIDDTAQRGHLVSLCGTDDPSDIVLMVKAMPAKSIATVVAVRAYAASAADLVTGLQCAKRMSFNANAVRTCLTGMPAMNNIGAVISQAVCAYHLTNTPKGSGMKAFINAVSRLVDEGYLKLVKSVDWYDMNGDNHTWEAEYEVQRKTTGHVEETFVIHFHPGCSKKDAEKPTLSRWHFKPDAHSSDRLKHQDAPDTVRTKCERSHDGT